ncbi:SH3 domain-containing protein [Paenochrobactrum sp. BZR 588]|uniref:SH3 domain-containing protein n=1 Tax=unclassified Paenochrobactrum TaxID=2639760 RepID=UPI00385395EB
MLFLEKIGNPKHVIRLAVLGLLVGVPTVGYAVPAIVTGNVNVREGAAARYKKIGTLRPGWQVEAGPCQAGWCHVRVGRIYGWASARYLSFNNYAPQIVQPSPYYVRQPGIIIQSGPVYRRQPYWGWNSWGRNGWDYRPHRHHYRPPYRPRPQPPVPYVPHYDPYGPSPTVGPGPVYPPMRNVPIGEGVRPAGKGAQMIPFGSGKIKNIVPAGR